MLKPATACLIAAALTVAPAVAQTGDRPTATGAGSTTAGSPSMRPGTSSDQTVTSPANPNTSTMGSTSSTGGSGSMGSSAPMTPSSTGTNAGASGSPGGSVPSTATSSGTNGAFIAQQQAGQMLASRLIGTTVVSQTNETIGDVNDVLFDRNGQVMAAVIGVGGFLGIGEKDVAVPFQQLEFMADNNASGAAATGTTGTVATTGAAAPSASGTMTTGTASGTAARDAMPNRVMLKMSKADLQAAPTFEEYGRTATTTTAPGAAAPGAATTTTTAPRQ